MWLVRESSGFSWVSNQVGVSGTGIKWEWLVENQGGGARTGNQVGVAGMEIKWVWLS